MAAFEKVNRPLGSRSDRPLFEFIAGKQSLKFRFRKAVSRHRVLRAHSGSSQLGKADPQERRNSPALRGFIAQRPVE
jgi:hypothetical protein